MAAMSATLGAGVAVGLATPGGALTRAVGVAMLAATALLLMRWRACRILDREVRIRLDGVRRQRQRHAGPASLGHITGGAAQELNAPVTAVVGNVRPLLSELARLRDRAASFGDGALEASIDRVRTIVDVMARGAERIAGIVKDLHVVSRPDDTAPFPMDLHEGIDVSVRLLRPRWANRIAVHKDYGEVPAIDAAPSRVHQILLGILADAFDAIEGSGNVWIATRIEDTQVVVTVCDDRSGMEPGHVEALLASLGATRVGRHDRAPTFASGWARGASISFALPVRKVAT